LIRGLTRGGIDPPRLGPGPLAGAGSNLPPSREAPKPSDRWFGPASWAISPITLSR